MGVYVYTLRAESRKIDGIEIARYGYAYKQGWDWHADSTIPSVRRRIRAMFSRAEDAVYKHHNVRHFIHGAFTEVKADPVAVYLTDKVNDSYVETMPGVIVGHLTREGRRLRFTPKEL